MASRNRLAAVRPSAAGRPSSQRTAHRLAAGASARWPWAASSKAASPRYLYGRHTMWRARIRAVIGDRDTAVALVQEAFAQGYARGGVMHLYPSLTSLRSDPAYQELLKPKE